MASKAAEAKARGIKAFRDGDWTSAEREFSAAIETAQSSDPQLHVFFSNRAAARMHLELFAAAESDSRECVRLSPRWAKGHTRLGVALAAQPGRADEALASLERALSLDPVSTAAREALDSLRKKKTNGASMHGVGGEGMLSWARIKAGRAVGDAQLWWAGLEPTTRTVLLAIVALCGIWLMFGGRGNGLGRSEYGGRQFSRRGADYSSAGYSGRRDYDEYYDHDHSRQDYDDYGGRTWGFGGLGSAIDLRTLLLIGGLVFAWRQGASPFQLLMLANMFGGGRRGGYGYGGYGRGGFGRRGRYRGGFGGF